MMRTPLEAKAVTTPMIQPLLTWLGLGLGVGLGVGAGLGLGLGLG